MARMVTQLEINANAAAVATLSILFSSNYWVCHSTFSSTRKKVNDLGLRVSTIQFYLDICVSILRQAKQHVDNHNACLFKKTTDILFFFIRLW